MKNMMQKILGTVFLLMPSFPVWGMETSFNSQSDMIKLELEPFSSFGQKKVAGVCFLGHGDCETEAGFGLGGEDFTLDTAEQCKNDGYNITSCTPPSYLSGQCPYNEGYYAQCKEDKEKACKDAGYVNSCGTGYVSDSAQICPYNSSYFKCKCNPCDGYIYTYEEAIVDGYVVDSYCQSCSTMKYKRKENPCSGYMTCECGGEIGTPTCKSGSLTKYAVCKTCCENRCTLASCPEYHDCDYEECSGKYCDKGCSGGYTDMCIVYSEYGEQSCSKMGYSQQSCVGDAVLCPFDTTYKFCM